MGAFVESLHILYGREPKGVTDVKLQELLAAGKINQEEYNYITSNIEA